MDTAPERRSFMETDFEPLLGKMHRIAGIDARNITKLKELIGHEQFQEKVETYVTDIPGQGPSSYAELGCILSHLLTIRRAYLEGYQVVLIMEDDLTPLLMPFWTHTISDLVAEADDMSNEWTILQLAWIYGQNKDIYTMHPPNTRQRLFPIDYQWGLQAYVVSRRGMEVLVDAHFSNRSANGEVQLLPHVEQAESYLSSLPNILVAVPSIFDVKGVESTIMNGQVGESERNALHRESNRRHIEETIQLYYNKNNGPNQKIGFQ